VNVKELIEYLQRVPNQNTILLRPGHDHSFEEMTGPYHTLVGAEGIGRKRRYFETDDDWEGEEIPALVFDPGF
jgi:hypothetical protein